MTEFTVLLNRFKSGDTAALEALTRMVYPQLKGLARSKARGSNMGATTLVQETYVKFLKAGELEPADRQEFFRLVATIMRRIIIDDIRHANAAKRKGLKADADSDLLVDSTAVRADFLVAVDEALASLAETDPRLVQVFECRYFGGYSNRETAEALDVSERTTERLWHAARQHVGAKIR